LAFGLYPADYDFHNAARVTRWAAALIWPGIKAGRCYERENGIMLDIKKAAMGEASSSAAKTRAGGVSRSFYHALTDAPCFLFFITINNY
jgi:hypothetical protein